ncbi:hypothetical protein XA68_15841 [Ophiocordyceps unilateralis]|uniref:Cell wall protein YJL171C/Tos1 C-terminal domain-containing protein n=1 Tax=Ophiocordyceps unilateralis TaxID=268505 RepID=A0A2A9P7A3_OPHUN|nr:hypothetical protein XA68_15841 [Ophiocordyceps unilateralis]
MNGEVVSWKNNYFGPTTPEPEAPPPQAPHRAVQTGHAPSAPEAVVYWPQHRHHPTAAAAAETSSPVPRPKPVAAGHHDASSSSPSSWERIAFYDASRQLVHNMRFLGNYGGQNSGVWSKHYGNSLAYLSADGHGGSASPETLKDTLIPSNKEFAIFSAEKCDVSCGFSRAHDVSYKGFGGANKIFLLRFRMPLDGNRDENGDMPAIWLLNGRIPRTVQYGDCSCWESRCGEVDIFEALEKGGTKCKSAIHLSRRGGSSDWFRRPTNGYITVAAIFHHDTASVTINILPDHTDFAESLDEKTVRKWIHGGHKRTLFDFNKV